MVKFMSGCFKHFGDQTTRGPFRMGFTAKAAVVVVVLWCISYLRRRLEDSFKHVGPLTTLELDDEGSAFHSHPDLLVGASFCGHS